MSTVCIIGAGELGGAVAHALARGDRVSRVVLIDPSSNAAAGKALDIMQSGAVERFHTSLRGTNDDTRVAGCAVCVMADRVGRGEWQGEEGLALVSRIDRFMPGAPFVFAGSEQADMMLAAAHDSGIARTRLIGSAPEALASAITSIVALEARCAPQEVQLTVLGTPPDGFVVPWTEASVGGHALEQVLSQAQLARVAARAARLWPPGPFTLGLAAARVTDGILRESRRSFSVLSVLDGEFGVRGVAGVLPAFLSSNGIAGTRMPTLDTRARVQLETALATGKRR